MAELSSVSGWNLEFISYLKEFTFDAGLPSVLLIVGCILLWFCIFRRFVKLLITFSCLFIVLICYKETPEFISKPLLSEEGKKLQSKENKGVNSILIQKALPDCVNKVFGIVVLGAGIYQKNLPSIVSQSRLLGLTSLLINSKKEDEWLEEKLPIVFTGGITNPFISQSESMAMKHFMKYTYGDKFLQLKIIPEENSKNTYQNAAFTKELFDKNAFHKNIVLVTSSTHMFRAKRTFEKQGFQVCPIPVTSFESDGSGIFNFENARKSVGIMNEYLGIVGYTFKGWLRV